MSEVCLFSRELTGWSAGDNGFVHSVVFVDGWQGHVDEHSGQNAELQQAASRHFHFSCRLNILLLNHCLVWQVYICEIDKRSQGI